MILIFAMIAALFLGCHRVATMREVTFESLYRQHHHELLGFLSRQLDSRDLAADLCHEVYLRLFNAPSRSMLDNPRAYLFRIARNLLIDHRRRQVPDLIAIDALEPVLVCPRACPETDACQQQCVHQLTRTLGELPERLRQALIWHRLEGLTQREIGQRLGVSERMAGRYIAQAMTRCQAELDSLDIASWPDV
ncbi:RNA polymerase sigma factor [Salinicola halimionae]|uniref:RNA polymerase sigma factor n=1 Tax=Salinicola halimionae TaxID=1949081 RepID=UPI001FD9A06E|nr:RNA polymerase sigma factor [Salinicola halimionae]